MLPEIKSLLKDCASSLLTGISRLDTLDNVFHIINEAIVEDAPLSIKEGGIIKPGYNADIDELKSLGSQGKSWLIDFENREKERTGIKFLKVGFNKVFGYYIEISKSNLGLVPGNYIRKQTLVNTERFITEELKIYEDKILTAQERLFDLEYRCFQEICDCLRSYIAGIQDSARAVASLDVLVSFAHVAYHNDYVRPQITGDGRIDIKGGRHPVVELAMPDARFVPNDVSLDMQGHRFAIITGPNMGGKSTYMRQVAVMVIMTQMGSFIPADEAHISLVDRIFTGWELLTIWPAGRALLWWKCLNWQ
jgi:DNA mismatch repair protein MutS